MSTTIFTTSSETITLDHHHHHEYRPAVNQSEQPNDYPPIPAHVKRMEEQAKSLVCVPVTKSVIGSKRAAKLAKVSIVPHSRALEALRWLFRACGSSHRLSYVLGVPAATEASWRAGRFGMDAAARTLVVRTARACGWREETGDDPANPGSGKLVTSEK